jgi:spore germination protein KC
LSIGKFKKLLIIILWIFTLGGCQIQELNHSAVVAGLGVNWEEEQLRVSMQMARPALAGQSSDSGPVFDVVSAQGRSLSEGIRKINLLFPRNPLVSQARLLVIGEQLAGKDLALITDACLRSQDIRKNLSVVVARESSPEDVLNTQMAMEPLSALAIPRMLRNQESQLGIYQEVTLEEFLNKLARPGIDLIQGDRYISINNFLGTWFGFCFVFNISHPTIPFPTSSYLP